MTRIVVEFEEWVADIKWPDGTVSKDVPHIRATCGNISYHTPIFNLGEQGIREAKALLFSKVCMEAMDNARKTS
jgi:hypothetical protein